ncbi:MAG: hypothetical protein H0X24_04085 [Ktedonobacterales bacterium]|nr:hypothetical protein [Ktedonobacterales bacterium]
MVEKVKATKSQPSVKVRQRRKNAGRIIEFLPFAATHVDAPTLSDVQQAASGVFARLVKAHLLQSMTEGNHDH